MLKVTPNTLIKWRRMDPTPIFFIKVGGVYKYNKSEIESLISQKDVRKLIDIKQSTLASWRRRGFLRFKKIGGACFYDKKQLYKILESFKNSNNTWEGGS